MASHVAHERPARDATLPAIGWRERVSFPDWGVGRLKAKIDTGARTSAIDVDEIELLPRDRVRFAVVTHRHDRDRRVWIEAPVVRLTQVRSSNGQTEQRPVVATRIKIGPVSFETQLTLVCRHGMLCRTLIGRAAVAGRFLVDAHHTHVLSRKRAPRTKQPQRHRGTEH